MTNIKKSSLYWLFQRFVFCIMQRHNVYHCKASINFGINSNRQLNLRPRSIVASSLPERIRLRLCLMKGRISSSNKSTRLECIKFSHKRCVKIKVADVNQGEVSDEDDDLCPVECVREFKTDDEFFRILEKAKEIESLVVVDFYRTSCGSCKYIEQGFAKLCKGSGNQEAAVIFLKHNVSSLAYTSSTCLVLNWMHTHLYPLEGHEGLAFPCVDFQILHIKLPFIS